MTILVLNASRQDETSPASHCSSVDPTHPCWLLVARTEPVTPPPEISRLGQDTGVPLVQRREQHVGDEVQTRKMPNDSTCRQLLVNKGQSQRALRRLDCPRKRHRSSAIDSGRGFLESLR